MRKAPRMYLSPCSTRCPPWRTEPGRSVQWPCSIGGIEHAREGERRREKVVALWRYGQVTHLLHWKDRTFAEMFEEGAAARIVFSWREGECEREDAVVNVHVGARVRRIVPGTSRQGKKVRWEERHVAKGGRKGDTWPREVWRKERRVILEYCDGVRAQHLRSNDDLWEEGGCGGEDGVAQAGVEPRERLWHLLHPIASKLILTARVPATSERARDRVSTTIE